MHFRNVRGNWFFSLRLLFLRRRCIEQRGDLSGIETHGLLVAGPRFAGGDGNLLALSAGVVSRSRWRCDLDRPLILPGLFFFSLCFLSKSLNGSGEIGGLEGLHDNPIRFDASPILRTVRLHAPNGQQHRQLGGVHGIAQSLAELQAAIAGHKDVEQDEFGFDLRDFLGSGCAVADSDYVVAGFAQNLLAHVLGGHTVIGE